MRDRLTDLLEKADLAIASCAGVVDDRELIPLIESVRGVRIRLAYPEDIVVVALAGGTGSGKSSLFNAIAGAELVEVGGVRPTTSRAAAGVPVAAFSRLDGYLDQMEIEERYPIDVEGFCILDLPDIDSVEHAHRFRAESILPLVDVVVWVTDPEKYNDARLHHDYLQPLAAYSEQFVFVLNQVDRLTGPQQAAVVADLRQTLSSNGMAGSPVVTVSAAPPAGPPTGIDELTETLAQKGNEGDALFGKLITDLAETTGLLGQAIRPVIDFDERAAPILESVTIQVASADVAGATTELTAFVDDVGREAGGRSGEKIERLAGDVSHHIARIDAETRPTSRRGWFGRRGSQSDRDAGQVRALLNEVVLRPMRAVLAQRALAQAAVAELALGVQSLR